MLTAINKDFRIGFVQFHGFVRLLLKTFIRYDTILLA